MSFKKHYVSVPTKFELANEDSWDKLDKKGTKFFMMRLHFMVKVRELEETPRDGGILTVFQSPEMVGQERVVSINIEKEYINFNETLSSSVIEKENIAELMTNLLAESSVPTFNKIRAGLKTKLAEKIKKNVTETFKAGNTSRYTKKLTFETKTTFNENLTEKIYQIKQYQKCSFDIYLSFIDYLFVNYSTSFFGLRKKRRKRPKVDNRNNRKRTNVLKLNKPIASLHFWKLIEDSSVYKKHSEYKNQVPNPDEKMINESEDKHQYHVEIPKETPSLYKLSNIAFPIKWIERECDKTKLDLKNIEEDDYIIKWGKDNNKKGI
jgi:hypothetical protein